MPEFRFLYESFSYEECEKTCVVNRDAASTLTSAEDRINLQGRIISHQAQVLEKSGHPQEAAVICQQEIDLRLDESPRQEILLAYSNCNLGIIYSSINDFPKSLEAFRRSRVWWEAHNSSRGCSQEFAPSMAVSEARCLIGLGEIKRAEELLKLSITKVKEEKLLNFGTLA